MARLTRLFEPLQIGDLSLRNRIVMAPMVNNFGDPDGGVSEATIHFYEARARGGVGLIIVESTWVHPTGRTGRLELGLDRDELIPGYQALVEAVHHHGAKIALQLVHGGRQAHQSVLGTQPVSPSPLPCGLTGEMARELTIAEIEELKAAFVQAAARAQRAGFDAVEIHCAHGYLLSEFLSPYANKRSDRYGGDAQGRMRFPLEVIAETRKRLGPDYPLLVRISAEEHVPGGLTLKDSQLVARKLEEAGVDCIDVSAGVWETLHWMIQPGFLSAGCLVPLARGIKEVVNIPVIIAGKLGYPVLAERTLAEGAADLIAIGRGLLADPDLPLKAQEGRLADIRLCTYCYHCTDQAFALSKPIRCAVNPELGREGEAEPAPTPPRKVLVVGGGPAGMEAARVAASRGHQVILYEQARKLGGLLNLVSKLPHKNEMTNARRFLTAQLESLGVRVRLGRPVTPVTVAEESPDVVVLATGASTVESPQGNAEHWHTPEEVISGQTPAGERVVVLGGGQFACETAEYLLAKGKKVTVVEEGPRLAADMLPMSRRFLLRRLRESDVALLTGATVLETSSDGVRVRVAGEEKLLEADSIVLAGPWRPRGTLAEQLASTGATIYTVGDCSEPGRVADAIADGRRVGRAI